MTAVRTTPGGGPPVEVVVHIGDGKTGTSAIQRVLRDHSAQLAAQATSYLGLMLERAPVRKYRWQHPGRIESFHRLPRSQATTELADVLAASVAEAARTGIRRLVWSNETLLGRGAATIDALRSLPPGSPAVTVVAYVRRPDRWARSAYLQWGLKHKSYPGPIRGFAEWSAKRKIELAPKLQAWRDAFGSRVQVRNFDATPDVTRDFLDAIGLDASAYSSVRRNTPLVPAELALRAAFNNRIGGNVPPRRFTELLGSEHVDFSLPLGSWMRALLPDAAALDAIRARCEDDTREVNEILRGGGQPPFDDAPQEVDPFPLDGDAVMAALLQLIAVQAERLEALEARVATLSSTGSSHATAGGEVAQAPAPPGAPPAPVVAALAPALGFFGAHEVDCLRIALDRPVSALRISLSDPRPMFLNLRGLEFRRGGKALVLPEGGWQAEQSSTAGTAAEHGADNLLRMKGIHSTSERAPWWTARFTVPVEAHELRITNRSDGWGSRSRTLKVEATDPTGRIDCLHDAESPDQLAASLGEACRLAGRSPLAAWPADAMAAARWRAELLDAIAERIRCGTLPLSDVAWPMLLPMLDVWHVQGEPLDAEWTLLAAFLLHQHRGKGGTSIKAFSLLLDNRERLLRLQGEMNALGGALGLGRFMLTRHGVKTEGVLRRDPQRFLSHLQAVVQALRALGRQPLLAYGTLLGAVRDRDFIAHDDDIDLLYRSSGSNRAEVEADLLGLKDALREMGFRVVDLLPNSLNLHVIDPRNSAVMDVFPYWEADGKAHLHMEAMRVRGIDPGILAPASEIEFLGCRLPAPARPEAFLEERYGPGWTVSDPFYEWPWPLKGTTP